MPDLAGSFLSLPSTPAAGPEKMLVRGRHGFFVILPDDLVVGLSLLVYGEYHEHEWQFLKRFITRGQTIVDAGSNLGTFAVPFAHAVGVHGKVYGFEPQPVVFDCLKQTIALNKFQNVELHNACLAAAPGVAEIFEPDYTHPANFSGVSFCGEGPGEVRYTDKRITAPCVTLDSVLQGRKLDLLKMDVEGMELDVLEGGKETISRDLPVIYAENNRRDKSPALIRFLAARGYKMWWHTGPFFNPHNFARNAENVYGKRHNINMIALSKPEQWALIPASLRPVADENDHIMQEDGRVIPSVADDVTGE